MKRILLPIMLGLAAIFGTSCYSEYGSVHTKRSAVLGGVVGAAGGALIGEHNDRELEGAAIGGVVGAITGGILGSARDEQYGRRSSQPAYQPTYRSYNQAPPYRSYGGNYNSGCESGYYQPRYNYYPRSRYRSSNYCR